MKYLDLFAGYGGFSLGIQKAYEKLCIKNKGQSEMSPFGNKEGQHSKQFDNGAEGFSCIGFSEIDKYAVQTYSKHFPEHKNYGDITKLDPSILSDFDLLCGGFPCQAFSIAGKRAGFEDTRGTLIYDVLRIVKEKHPKLVLLENVKGLLSHDGGRTFKTIISSLAELGYAVEWQVLNAKNFGVPQNRERVFIVGHLGGFRGRQVFPLRESGKVSTGQNGQGIAKHRGTYVEGDIQQGVPNERPVIRRLTPTECERLMGLPDGWTAEGIEGKISDTQRYKLCGNGVVVNVVEEIIKRLLHQ